MNFTVIVCRVFYIKKKEERKKKQTKALMWGRVGDEAVERNTRTGCAWEN